MISITWSNAVDITSKEKTMRIKVEYSYLGTKYSGSQKQECGNTIQDVLEATLSNFFGTKVDFVASGRTDAGVSAIKQIGHFDIDDVILQKFVGEINERNLNSIVIRVNYILPEDIRLSIITVAPADYHARFATKVKTYAYNFYYSKTPIPYLDQFCLWVKRDKLDIKAMRQALDVVIGRHDFTSFCASNTDVVDKVRTIVNADIVASPLGYYSIILHGNGFLYNMVRIIAGTLIDVGRGKISVQDFQKILDAKDRTKAGKTAGAEGLVLVDVDNDFALS